MSRSFSDDFIQASQTPSPSPSPGDPIATAFAQYKALAQLRCSQIRPEHSVTTTSKVKGLLKKAQPPATPKSSTEVIDTPIGGPQQVLVKWADHEGVIRTRNGLQDQNLSDQVPESSRGRRFERDMKRAFDILVNKNDIREHVLLNSGTAEALKSYSAADYPKFLQHVLTEKIVTSDMLVRIGRGPIFEPWMLKSLVFDAVMASSTDFNKGIADNAVAATAHYIANNGMSISRSLSVVGHEEWKSESESSLEKYFEQVDTATTDSNIFTLFEQIILQFGTPANIGNATVEELIGRAALTYAIILQAASRAVEQLVRDSTAHAAKVSLDVSVIFAAITAGTGVAPVPYLAVIVDEVEVVIQTVVSNYVNAPVGAVTAVASTLNDQFSNYILKPALAGDSVPGLLQPAAPSVPPTAAAPKDGAGVVINGDGANGVSQQKDPAPASPALTPAAKRRKLGELFQTKYQDYIGMLDTVHTPMRNI